MKKILIILLIVLVVIQFIPVNIDNPTYDMSDEIFSNVDAPEHIESMIKGACYDCHSYETREPWYFNVAPVSWWLVDHVEEGRDHLNFSVWAKYDSEKKAHKLEEAMEEVEEKHMPLKSYTWMHQDSRISEEERAELVDWFKQQYNKI